MFRHVVDQMNSLVCEWCDMFDNPPEPMIRFSENDLGILLCNGIALCEISKVDVESFMYDMEFILFSTKDGCEFELGVCWRFAEPPYLSYIKKNMTLYQAS